MCASYPLCQYRTENSAAFILSVLAGVFEIIAMVLTLARSIQALRFQHRGYGSRWLKLDRGTLFYVIAEQGTRYLG